MHTRITCLSIGAFQALLNTCLTFSILRKESMFTLSAGIGIRTFTAFDVLADCATRPECAQWALTFAFLQDLSFQTLDLEAERRDAFGEFKVESSNAGSARIRLITVITVGDVACWFACSFVRVEIVKVFTGFACISISFTLITVSDITSQYTFQ